MNISKLGTIWTDRHTVSALVRNLTTQARSNAPDWARRPNVPFVALAALEAAEREPSRTYAVLRDDSPLILDGEAPREWMLRLSRQYGWRVLEDLSPEDVAQLRDQAPMAWNAAKEQLRLPLEELSSHIGVHELRRAIAGSLRARARTLAWRARVAQESRCLQTYQALFEIEVAEKVKGGFAGLGCGQRVFIPGSRAGRSAPGVRIIARLLKYSSTRGSFVFEYVRHARNRPEQVSRWNPSASRPTPPDSKPRDIMRVVTGIEGFEGTRDALLSHPSRPEAEREAFTRCWLDLDLPGAMAWADENAGGCLSPSMKRIASATHGDPSGAWAWAVERRDQRMFEVVWRATGEPRWSDRARTG